MSLKWESGRHNMDESLFLEWLSWQQLYNTSILI